mmetsp:Transcript_17285/g.41282  ORF Transcript_17285/g.41282 Transcript_17285/m.41282 type:complete len:226 (+) Transcript_17285:195-872(+)
MRKCVPVRLVNLGEHSVDEVLVLDRQGDEVHQAKVFDRLADALRQLLVALPEAPPRRRHVVGEHPQILPLCEELKRKGKLAVGLQEIHLGEDVDVRQLEVKHRREGHRQRRHVLGRVGAEVRVDEVHRREPPAAPPGELLHDGLQRAVDREELHLAGEIEQDIRVAALERLELLLEPVDVLGEELQRINKCPVGTQVELILNHLEANQILNVHSGFVSSRIVGRV